MKNPIPVHGNQIVYSLAEHGENYKELAENFAKNHADNVVGIEGAGAEKPKTKRKSK